MTRHHSCRVSPFGHPRIHARLAAPRGITQPPTSFIGSQCQGIHHAPLNTYNTKPKNEFNSHTPIQRHASTRKICITTKQQPTPTHPPPPPEEDPGRNLFMQAVIQMLATTIHKSNTTPHHQSRAATRTPNPTTPNPKKGDAVTLRAGAPPTGRGPRACCLRTQQCVWQSQSPTRFPLGPNMFVVHQTRLHYREQAIFTNRPGHRTPTRCGQA